MLVSHCFLVASYIQGKSTKNTVNRVRLGPLVLEVFVVKQKTSIAFSIASISPFPYPRSTYTQATYNFRQNRRKIQTLFPTPKSRMARPSLCAVSSGGWKVWCSFIFCSQKIKMQLEIGLLYHLYYTLLLQHI